MLDIQAIKNQIDLVDIIGRDETLVQHGDSFRSGHITGGHESKSGTCLDVSPDKQLYHCRNCGESGDVINWVMNRDGCSFIDAVKTLCAEKGIPMGDLTPEDIQRINAEAAERKRIRPIMKEIMLFFHESMEEKHWNYYRERGASDETIKELLLGYAPADPKALVETMREKYSPRDLYLTGMFHKTRDGAIPAYLDRLVFPYWRNNEVVYSIARLPDHYGLELTLSLEDRHETDRGKYKKHLMHKEGREYVSKTAVEHIIYGCDSARGAKAIIITEGIVDAILAHQAKFACISPVTTRFTNEDVEKLVTLTKRAETTYVINDNENSEAGLKGALKTAEALFSDSQDVRIVILPKPGDREKYDLADFLADTKGEKDALQEVMESASDFIEWHIQKTTAETNLRKQQTMIKSLLQKITTCEPIQRDFYLKAMVKAELASISTLKQQLKIEEKATDKSKGLGSDEEKTAIQLADELIERDYTDKAGKHTLVFQNATWYEYDEGKYQEIDLEEMRTIVAGYIRDDGSNDVSETIVRSVKLAMQPVVRIPNSQSQPCWRNGRSGENLISLRNGILHLDKLFTNAGDALQPHTPDLFILSSQPYDYNPDAQCPRWLTFLDEALPEKEDQKTLQEFFGLCLTHDTRFHYFLFIQGESRTGKGVTFETLQALIGKENTANVALREFGNTFAFEGMLGKKLNINAEVPELDKIAENVLKEYTGGDTMLTINRKYKTPITTTQRARLAFSTNHYPNFRDRSQAVWNRMLLIQFDQVAEKRDLDLGRDIVANELGGIFNWAVDGYKRLCTQGACTRSWQMIKEIEEYKDENIGANQFFRAYLNVDFEENYATHSQTLYRYYHLWQRCENRGIQAHTNFGRDIATYLKNACGLKGVKDRSGKVYPHIGFESGAKERIVDRAIKDGVLRLAPDETWDFDQDLLYDYGDDCKRAFETLPEGRDGAKEAF